METSLTHTLGRHVELRAAGRLLFRYEYAPDIPQVEAPKPRFHPVGTLGGETVTLLRPHDHRWHQGITMTSANLSGENFWGGPTYVEGRGYAQLDNVGRIEHEGWEAVDSTGALPHLVERLAWITRAGDRWLEERRVIRVVEVDGASGHWTLGLEFHLRNVSGQTLELGSPTTAGRPMAGYGGLFWRGPRSFLGGAIRAAGGLEGPDVMGQRAEWLSFTGRHDGSDAATTLVFVDHPDNPRYPTRWFVRSDPYACVSCSFMFDEVYDLEAGRELALRYAIVVADGDWPPARVEAWDTLARAPGVPR
jgi:Methane oxygenase PmoA